MEHMTYLVESLLKQSAKKELNYREFPYMALQNEWSGRHQRSMEPRLKQARLAARKAKVAPLMQTLYDWIQTQIKTPGSSGYGKNVCVPAETMECVERILQ